MAPLVVLHLLSSSRSHPLQSWSFTDRSPITMGRAEENDIVVADPYVSRAHAYLEHESDGGWRLVSVSQQQIYIHGEPHSTVWLKEGAVFRLGPHGCYIRMGDVAEKRVSNTTMAFDSTLMPMLELDRKQMEEEVSQITGGGYFQELQATARKLREQRAANQTQDTLK